VLEDERPLQPRQQPAELAQRAYLEGDQPDRRAGFVPAVHLQEVGDALLHLEATRVGVLGLDHHAQRHPVGAGGRDHAEQLPQGDQRPLVKGGIIHPSGGEVEQPELG